MRKLRVWSSVAALAAPLLCIGGEAGKPRTSVSGADAGISDQAEPDPGRAVYEARCAVCHGMDGTGNGRLAALIKKPPPFNLTLSVASESYLSAIISGGGASVGRSPQMPSWEQELDEHQLAAVISYIKTFRALPVHAQSEIQ